MRNPHSGARYPHVLLKLFLPFELQLRASGIPTGKGDKLPKSVFYRPLKDIDVVIISQYAKVTSILPIPTVHDLCNIYGPIPKMELNGPLIPLIARITLYLNSHCQPFLSTQTHVV